MAAKKFIILGNKNSKNVLKRPEAPTIKAGIKEIIATIVLIFFDCMFNPFLVRALPKKIYIKIFDKARY